MQSYPPIENLKAERSNWWSGVRYPFEDGEFVWSDSQVLAADRAAVDSELDGVGFSDV